MSSSNINLPPVRHLPHWTRVGSLGKPCAAPRLPPGIQLEPLRPGPPEDRGSVMRAHSPEEGSHTDPDPRVASLQRNIQFLQQQHQDTLGKLHTEIEYLRRENKELQYKLIMETPTVSRKAGLPVSRRGLRPPTQGSDVRSGLYLEEQLQDTRPLHDQAASLGESTDAAGSFSKAHGTEPRGGLITSLQPLRIHSSPAHPPRPPTLHECEVIIRQLYNANSIQSQELLRVKALLRDIVFSKKITPENYILTKTYLADGTRKFSETEKLPKLGLQTFPEKISETPQSAVILPALKQSFSTSIADRQRRARAVQRGRFKRVVQ
ncbi:coiled-coil domain-containing protein 74B [Boleophthalmus pectinirostris]|uniref:coiled-coil domain-containing protein 74B n=1 Tax=Boleophthalmus pectinirostris TaxID=150288 RepID=UPI00242B47AF|nr:coiled-coil domain-containing protein 74B [Boleophthalmus pectinirostris]